MLLNSSPFTVKTITESPTSPSDITFVESTAPTVEVAPVTSSNSVTGDNLSGGKFGDDEIFSGTMFGKDEFGGISRFKNR